MIDDDEKYNTAAHNHLEQACLFLAENSIHIRHLGLWLDVYPIDLGRSDSKPATVP
jgi:hypothetical protein